MRYSAEHKDGTRRKIVAAASRAFRQHGVEGASVSEIMAEAGLTVGGFYRHFESKEGLFREALEEAMGETLALMQQRRAAGEGSGATGHEWMAKAAAVYLSPEHRDHHARGCPLPGLTAEVSRRDTTTRQSFEQGLEGLAGEMAHRIDPDDPTTARGRAWAFLSTLVGSLLLARGVADDELAAEILASGRLAVGADERVGDRDRRT